MTATAPLGALTGTVFPSELAMFVGLFAVVVVIGLFASRWRRGDLEQLDEWGLAGRRFGGFVSWFLQGGSIYTTYSFIAVPALVFGKGVIGFYALPYLVLAYLVMYLTVPRLWTLARDRNYVTASDFVKDRFGSRPLAVVIALTGIVAMVPYVALQVYGIEICLSQIGVPVEAALIVATTVLALITYVSGLRAAALIAMAKDVLIWTTVLVAVVYIPIRLGGYTHIFHAVPPSQMALPHSEYLGFSTLAIGSALALYLYPHTFTGSLSSSATRVSRLNAATLPVYTIMLGLLALLGYMGIAAGVQPDAHYGANVVVPALFQQLFPHWFAGFALAAVAIGALVPASVMSIAAGSLFGRNVYGEIVAGAKAWQFRRQAGAAPRAVSEEVAWGADPTVKRETGMAKGASFVIKFLGVGFILAVPATFVINFQLAGGVWIVQTLPAVFLAPFLPWLDRRAVLAGWAVGMAWGTYLLVDAHFASSTVTLSIFGDHLGMYMGVPTACANLLVALGGSAAVAVFRRVRRAGVPAAG
ncbi:MAG TPA: sodium:solute symporter [Acidimicrobiales bacterium]|nr:sodium:solute symporter [Acidimicrobiales bacterium]